MDAVGTLVPNEAHRMHGFGNPPTRRCIEDARRIGAVEILAPNDARRMLAVEIPAPNDVRRMHALEMSPLAWFAPCCRWRWQ